MKITQTLKIKINKYQYSFTEKSQYLRVAKQALSCLCSFFSDHLYSSLCSVLHFPLYLRTQGRKPRTIRISWGACYFFTHSKTPFLGISLTFAADLATNMTLFSRSAEYSCSRCRGYDEWCQGADLLLSLRHAAGSGLSLAPQIPGNGPPLSPLCIFPPCLWRERLSSPRITRRACHTWHQMFRNEVESAGKI
jgi:hypothetical protein